MVKPIKAKVEVIETFPTPRTKKELQRFLGMAGYYRKFCQNFSDVASPLTNLLAKNVKYVWSDETENGFNKIKAITDQWTSSDSTRLSETIQVGHRCQWHRVWWSSHASWWRWDRSPYFILLREVWQAPKKLLHYWKGVPCSHFGIRAFWCIFGYHRTPSACLHRSQSPHLHPQDEQQKSETSEVEFDLAGI